MAKGARRKVIKRVYESGKETTLSGSRQSKKSLSSKRKTSPSDASLATKQKVNQEIVRPKSYEQLQPMTPALQAQRVSEQQDLSWKYGTTYLTLMAKDPSWIYAYWEIAPDSLHNLLKSVSNHHLKEAQTVLRMYDVTLLDFNGTNANKYFDIEVGPRANNWYVNLWSDSVSYIGEIGLRFNDGRFFALARSNAAHTPRKTYSPRHEQIWMKVEDNKPQKPHVFARPKSGYQAKQRTPAPKQKRTIYLSEEDIRRYYSRLSPLLRDIISARLDSVYGKRAGKYKFVLEGEGETHENNPLLPKDYFIKRVIVGASESLVFLGASEEMARPTSSASESLVKPEQRKFFFELNAELIVYGRTEPDATVHLGDKKIPLRSDGTFSLRFALPDGNIPLEFKAEAADKKETRRINTYVERITYYK